MDQSGPQMPTLVSGVLVSYVDVVLTISQDSPFPNGTHHDLLALVLT
jgi:hypothetical protein